MLKAQSNGGGFTKYGRLLANYNKRKRPKNNTGVTGYKTGKPKYKVNRSVKKSVPFKGVGII